MRSIFFKIDFLKKFSTGKNTCVGATSYKIRKLNAGTFIKKKLQHRCFPVNIIKFIEHLRWLLSFCYEVLFKIRHLPTFSSWSKTSGMVFTKKRCRLLQSMLFTYTGRNHSGTFFWLTFIKQKLVQSENTAGRVVCSDVKNWQR